MNIPKIIVFCFFTLLVSNTGYAQGKLDVHFGESVPLKDFEDEHKGENVGGASAGWNLGMQYTYRFSKKGWGVFAGLDYFNNPMQKDYVEKLKEWHYETDAWYKSPVYINIPLSCGLNYTKNGDEFGVFLQAGYTVNYLNPTNAEVRIGDEVRYEESGTGWKIGVMVGGGLLIKKRFSVSLNYLALGKHDIANSSLFIPGHLKIDLLQLTIGYRFFNKNI